MITVKIVDVQHHHLMLMLMYGKISNKFDVMRSRKCKLAIQSSCIYAHWRKYVANVKKSLLHEKTKETDKNKKKYHRIDLRSQNHIETHGLEVLFSEEH